MLIRIIALILLVFGMIAVASMEAAKEKEELVVNALPEGDASAGRKAFMDLRCFTCHVVTGEKEMPKAWFANLGPELGRTADIQIVSADASAFLKSSNRIFQKQKPFRIDVDKEQDQKKYGSAAS